MGNVADFSFEQSTLMGVLWAGQEVMPDIFLVRLTAWAVWGFDLFDAG